MIGARRRPAAKLACLALAALAWGAAPGVAEANPPPPADLSVDGGEDRWRSTDHFVVKWEVPKLDPYVAAIRYRILDPFGAVVVGPSRLGWQATSVWLQVGGPPGAYTAEVWFEDASMRQGPAAAVKLRFDDARPGHAVARPPTGWVGRTGFPLAARIEHPVGPPPLSGIRGYAVSVDRAAEGEPCADPSRCGDAETDLRGGAADDTYWIDELPEGTSRVHVVAVSGSGMRSALAGHTAIRVDTTDPVTRLAGAPGGWANQTVELVATAADAASGMSVAGVGETAAPFTAIRIDGGRPKLAAGSSVSATVFEQGLHTVAYYARDAAGNVNDGGGGNGLPNHPPAIEVVRIDREPPAVSFSASQDPADPELIEARVLDSLSGPSSTRGSIGVRGLGSGDLFEALPTKRVEGALKARWDSDAYPPGVYEFRATGYDAAGNSTATGRRAGGAAMALVNPLKVPTVLSAGFGGERLVWHRCARRRGRRHCRRQTVSAFARRPARRVVPYGRSSRYGGQLTTAAGGPLGGVAVQVVEHLGDGKEPVERATTVRTDAAGRFTIRLAPGPNREIFAAFGGTRTLSRSASGPVSLSVRSRVRLRASSATAAIGGRPIVFTGAVAAAGEIPEDGKSVALQFRLPGLPWTEFRTIRTNRRGRFRHAYRFADNDSRGVRFQFRAYATAEAGWPYEPGGSRPVAVRGL